MSKINCHNKRCGQEFTQFLDEIYCEPCTASMISDQVKPIKIGYELECYELAVMAPNVPIGSLLLNTVIRVSTQSGKDITFGLRIILESTVSGKCLEFVTTPVNPELGEFVFAILREIVKRFTEHVDKACEVVGTDKRSYFVELFRIFRDFTFRSPVQMFHNIKIYRNVSIYYTGESEDRGDMQQHVQINFSFARAKNVEDAITVVNVVSCGSALLNKLRSLFFKGGISIENQYEKRFIDYEQQGMHLFSTIANSKKYFEKILMHMAKGDKIKPSANFYAKCSWLPFLVESNYHYNKLISSIPSVNHGENYTTDPFYSLYNETRLNRNNYGEKDMMPLRCRGIKFFFTPKELEYLHGCIKSYNSYLSEDDSDYVYGEMLTHCINNELAQRQVKLWPFMLAELVFEARLPVQGADLDSCQRLIQQLCCNIELPQLPVLQLVSFPSQAISDAYYSNSKWLGSGYATTIYGEAAKKIQKAWCKKYGT